METKDKIINLINFLKENHPNDKNINKFKSQFSDTFLITFIDNFADIFGEEIVSKNLYFKHKFKFRKNGIYLKTESNRFIISDLQEDFIVFYNDNKSIDAIQYKIPEGCFIYYTLKNNIIHEYIFSKRIHLPFVNINYIVINYDLPEYVYNHIKRKHTWSLKKYDYITLDGKPLSNNTIDILQTVTNKFATIRMKEKFKPSNIDIEGNMFKEAYEVFNKPFDKWTEEELFYFKLKYC